MEEYQRSGGLRAAVPSDGLGPADTSLRLLCRRKRRRAADDGAVRSPMVLDSRLPARRVECFWSTPAVRLVLRATAGHFHL